MENTTWWKTRPEKTKKFTIPAGVIVLTFFLIIASAATSLALFIPDSSVPRKGPEQSIEYPAPVNDVLYQCGGIFNFYPSERNYGVIPQEVVFTEERDIPLVPTRIQAYGYMSENPWTEEDERFYTQDSDKVPTLHKLLRGMWEDYHVIWYEPEEVTELALNEMERLTQKNAKVIVVPWNMNASMPLDRNYSFATWNLSQSCGEWNVDTAEAFLSLHDPKERDIDNPPMAPLNEEGQLFGIPRFGNVSLDLDYENLPEVKKDSYYYE